MVGMMRGDTGRRRRWRIALVVSLALNLLFAGVIGAWVVRPLFRGSPPRPEFGRIVDRMAHRLNDQDAAAMRRAYDTHREDIARLGVVARESRDRVRDALRADSFDADALAAAMTEMRAARGAMEAAIQGVMQESAAAMSADGRRTLARGPRDER